MAENNQTAWLDDDLALLKEAGEAAGQIAMRYFGNLQDNEVWQKQGHSPVSEADIAIDNFLKDVLLSARPDYGWLSEETEDNDGRLVSERLFVVDPIDGTRGFIAGSKQWCVSIAVVDKKRPVAGVLECPALKRSFIASAISPAMLNDQPVSKLSKNDLNTVTASRKLNTLMEERHADAVRVHPFVPSLAYRIAMVANGEIDGAIARPGAHDWDLAAAEIILQQSGGLISGLDGAERLYNQASPRSGSLLASGRNNHEKLLDLAKSGGFLH